MAVIVPALLAPVNEFLHWMNSAVTLTDVLIEDNVAGVCDHSAAS